MAGMGPLFSGVWYHGGGRRRAESAGMAAAVLFGSWWLRLSFGGGPRFGPRFGSIREEALTLWVEEGSVRWAWICGPSFLI